MPEMALSLKSSGPVAAQLSVVKMILPSKGERPMFHGSSCEFSCPSAYMIVGMIMLFRVDVSR